MVVVSGKLSIVCEG
jgi:hypothetical protein